MNGEERILIRQTRALYAGAAVTVLSTIALVVMWWRG